MSGGAGEPRFNSPVCPLLGTMPSSSRGLVPARLVITAEQGSSGSCLGAAPTAPPGAELSSPCNWRCRGAGVSPGLGGPCSAFCLGLPLEGQKQTSCHCVTGLLPLSCLPAFLQMSVRGGLLSGCSSLLFFQVWCTCFPASNRAANQLQERDARWSLAPSYLCYQIHTDPLGHRLLVQLRGGTDCSSHRDHFM